MLENRNLWVNLEKNRELKIEFERNKIVISENKRDGRGYVALFVKVFDRSHDFFDIMEFLRKKGYKTVEERNHQKDIKETKDFIEYLTKED